MIFTTADSFYENKLYKELCELTHKLEPWYDVDKIRWHSVYIWTKGDENDEENPLGENVFDIWPNEILFFVKDHVIPAKAMPVIREIQEKLKEIDVWRKINSR